MNARRPARARRRAALYYRIQQIRLARIAAGDLEPLYPREHYFLWTLQARGRARQVDFIVPGLLFMAEIEERKLADAAVAAAPADAAIAS